MIKQLTLSSPPKILAGIRWKSLLRLLYILALLLIAVTGYGQASLPFGHNGPWQSVSKTGYTQSGLGSDLTNIGPTSEGGSANFTTVGSKIVINFNSTPGTLSYYLKANTTKTTYTSTFAIEQSADGTNYSPLRTVVDQTKASATKYTDEPASTTRFIRFTLTAISSSQRIMFDEIALTQGVPEINLKQTTDIATGGTYNFGDVGTGGTSGAKTFTIENLGKGTLSLTGTPIVALSGTNASEFVIDQTTTASSVSGGQNTTFTVAFNPTSTGAKTAAITILNNDSDEGTYTINLMGNGTAPSLKPTITSFSPTSGLELSLVIITGTNFVSVTSVTFNGVESLNFFENSSTEIEVEVPVGATNGFITVTTPEGTATSTEIFTVLGPPTITSFSPIAGSVGSLVLIKGTHFNGVGSVTFNGVEATNFFENSDTELEVEVPVGATTGLLTVTTAEGTATSADVFTVLSPTITVTASLTSFKAATGTTSAPQSYTVSGTDLSADITVSAPAHFQVSLTSDSGYGTSVVLPQVSGTVASTTVYVRYAPTADGNHSGNISHASTGATTQLLGVSGTTVFPQIAITGTFTTVTNQVINTPTEGQQFTVEGKNLTDNITITAPANFEVSSTSSTSGFGPSVVFAQSGGAVAATNFWIRYNPTTLLTHSDNVVAASSGATSQNIAVRGNAITTEPTASSFIATGTTTTNSIELTFGGGDGARRIVVAREGANVNSNPVDGTTYTANAHFRSGSQIGTGNYVVYAGTGGAVTVTGLGGGTKYYFTVYDYNDADLAGAENYLSTGTSTNKTTLTATYVWNVPAGNWDDPNSWSPARTTPSSTDIIVFDGAVQATPAVTVNFSTTNTIGQFKFINNSRSLFNIDSDATLNLETAVDQAGDDFVVEAGSDLTITATSSSKKLVIFLRTGKTGSVAGSITLEGTAAAAHRIIPEDASSLIFQTGSTFTTGTFFSGYPFGAASGSVKIKAGGTYVYKSGSGPFGAPAGFEILAFESGSTYRHEATSAPDLSGRTYANFELKHTDFNLTDLTGTGSLNVENLTTTAGTAMGINLTGTVNIKGNIAVNAGNLSFNPASANTINLMANGDQTISGGGGLAFGSNAAVKLASSATVRLEKNMVVHGSLNVGNALYMKANVISGGGSFSMSPSSTLGIGHADGISYSDGLFTITNTGNVQTAGMRDYNTSANYIYNGTVAQITGDGLPDVVNNLTIANEAGVTSSVAQINVQGVLALQSGKFTTAAAKSLTVTETGSISGGSSTSYVNGPLAQIVAATSALKVFPIGKDNAYLPVTLSLSHGDTQLNTYTAEQFNTAPPSRTVTGELKRVSGVRHFNISKTGGSTITGASVTLHYNNDLNEPEASNLRIAKSSGTEWVSIGGSGSAAGTGAGSITSGSFTTFSDFVLSSIADEPAPLPVSLMSFTATLAKGQVDLEWVTASEQNNDRFEVERSSNGTSFQRISTVKGAGTSSEKRRYNDVDRKPLNGTSYYRLKQVDHDGTVAYSKTVAVKNNGRAITEATVYPNPTSGILQVDLGTSATNVKIMIVNMVGQIVRNEQVSSLEGLQTFSLDVSRLPKGAYQLLIQSDEFKTTKKFIKTDR
jgi:hypothetical protein